MMRILTWLLVPLGMMASVFLMECLVNGVDLSIVQEGDCLTISTLNNTNSCAMFQWNTTLATNGWHDYHGYLAGAGEIPVPHLKFTVKATPDRVFWRLRNCSAP